jgi:hypothetical protein
MNEFMMIFRLTPNFEVQISPEQMQADINQWQKWIGGIAAQGKFISMNRLSFEGKTLYANHAVSEGPYAEVKEIVGGYVLVKAKDIDEALKLAETCPILYIDSGGHIEVREIMPVNN